MKELGKRKIFKGKFRLCKTDNILKYWQQVLLEEGKAPHLKDFKPIVPLNTKGIIVDVDKFMIRNGDVFFQKPVKVKERLSK